MKTKYIEGIKHGKLPQLFTGSNHLSRKDSPGVPLQGGRVSHPRTRLWSISTCTLDPFVTLSPAWDRWHAAESTYIFVILRRHLWGVLSLYISQWIGWFSWMSFSFALGSLLLHDVALAVADLSGWEWGDENTYPCIVSFDWVTFLSTGQMCNRSKG